MTDTLATKYLDLVAVLLAHDIYLCTLYLGPNNRRKGFSISWERAPELILYRYLWWPGKKLGAKGPIRPPSCFSQSAKTAYDNQSWVVNLAVHPSRDVMNQCSHRSAGKGYTGAGQEHRPRLGRSTHRIGRRHIPSRRRTVRPRQHLSDCVSKGCTTLAANANPVKALSCMSSGSGSPEHAMKASI